MNSFVLLTNRSFIFTIYELNAFYNFICWNVRIVFYSLLQMGCIIYLLFFAPVCLSFRVHARGDDKIQEAKIFGLDSYMKYAPLTNISHVFLATDDKKNLKMVTQFPTFQFHMLQNQRGRISGVGNRYSRFSFRNLLFDLFLLSECDMFIGTDASQISRLAYELQQTHHIDASARSWSIHSLVKGKRSFFWYLI